MYSLEDFEKENDALHSSLSQRDMDLADRDLQISYLKRKVTRLQDVIRLIEWCGDLAWCEACESHQPDHSSDCPVKEALSVT